MHTEIVRGLRIRHAPLFDQSHSLKLELACKFPSLHDAPPVPSKHLTRCLWNRVQAKPPVPGTPDSYKLMVEELREYAKKLDLVKRLRAYGQAMKFLANPQRARSDDHYFLL